ncbi:MAG: hypothetical protein M3O71_22795 [Bacteroidota bacterium]|nr:hypothetical protein [Bacteroidota bacterium]
MKYNIYIEDYFGAKNELDISLTELHKVIEELTGAGFLKKQDQIFYLSKSTAFGFSIFTNNYKSDEISLWDYCVQNNLYGHCTTPPTGGIVISPKFLSLFGTDCTFDFVKNKLIAF